MLFAAIWLMVFHYGTPFRTLTAKAPTAAACRAEAYVRAMNLNAGAPWSYRCTRLR